MRQADKMSIARAKDTDAVMLTRAMVSAGAGEVVGE